MKILLLGATGFLGTRITKRLDKEGIAYTPVSLSLGTDLRDLSQFRTLFEKEQFEIIFNCAAFVGGIQFVSKRAGEVYYNNSLINTYLFELAKEFKIKRIINPISNCSYPRDLFENFKESEWWNGELEESVLTYGFIRKASYVQSWAYHRQYGLETINLLIPNMYGPDDHFQEVRSHAMGAQIMKITEAHVNKQPKVIVWGSGKPIREWLYVDDCVNAMLRAIDIPFTNEPINVGVGRGISVWEMVTAIKKAVGYEGELELDTTKPDGAPYKVMDATKFKKAFSYFKFTPLEEGIPKTVDYYKESKGYV